MNPFSFVTKAFGGRLAQAFRGSGLFQFMPYGNLPHKYEARLAYRSPVCAGLNGWLSNLVQQAPIQVVDKAGNPVDHPFLEMVGYPSEGNSYGELMRQTVFSYLNSGFAMWLPLYLGRNLAGAQYISPWRIRHYNSLREDWADHPYTIDLPQPAQLDMLATMRYNIKEGSYRTPESPYYPAALFLALDVVLAEGSYGRWRNPLPGGLITLKDTPGRTVTKEDTANFNKAVEGMTRVNMGQFINMDTPADVHEFRGEARRLSATEYSNLVEERIAACVLLHPACASLGSSFQNQVGATLVEEVRQSYVNGGFPFLERLADTLTTNVLHAWYTNSLGLRVHFDISGIDYETAENRQAETERWIDVMDALNLKREWVANRLGIPEEALAEIVEQTAPPATE